MSGAAQPAASAFDRIGAEALATRNAPGFALAVVRDGKLVYVKGFGLADVERSVPVEPQTRFAIGSLTKGFTAASILLLAQRGKLGLDDPLEKYLPSFPNARAITLRMLLDQTSGLHNYPFSGEHPWPSQGPIKLDTVLSFLASDKPDFPAGTRSAYSNANYALLSAVIAKASGLDEAAFLQRNVFGPLKMTATGYGYAAQERSGVAKPYEGRAPFRPQQPRSLDLFAGAGAIVSTAPDVAAWDVALMQRELLDAASMKELWTTGKLASGETLSYAMGFVPAMLAGHREVWHNGLAPGAGGYCYNAIFPDDNLAVVVLSNGYNFDASAERVVGQVLATYDQRVAAQLAAAAPPPVAAEDRAVTARAKDWFRRLQTGTVDLTQVDPAFARQLRPEFLALIRTDLADKGTPTGWIYQGSRQVPGATIYRYWIRLGGVPQVFSVALRSDGKIAGSQLTPLGR